MATALYFIVFVAVGCFMASRVYLLIFKGELNVKGVVYSRHGTPIGYWFTMAFALIGAAFSFMMAAAGIFEMFPR